MTQPDEPISAHRDADDLHRIDTETIADQLAQETDTKADQLAHETAAKAAQLAQETAAKAAVVAARTQSLADTAAALTRTVRDLTAEVSTLTGCTDRNRRATGLALVGLAVDLVLSVVLVAVVIGQGETAQRLETQIAQQQQIRSKVLCPLYGVLLKSRSDVSRDHYPAGPGAYDEAFAELNAAYSFLSCDQ